MEKMTSMSFRPSRYSIAASICIRLRSAIGISKTSRATATRDLRDLVEKGALTKTGALRHTRYFLNPASA
jgi:hypothetical protein